MSVYLAYDGSINGDWIARYAVRLALHHPERALTLIRVEDHSLAPDQLEAGLARIAAECRAADVAFGTVLVPLARSVLAALVREVPAGRDTYLVCGARVRGARRGFLAGTISEGLLRQRRCNVLAVRVVQPGLLGAPRRLLLPLSGDAGDLRAGLPFLRLLAPDIREIHLLRVMTVGRFTYRHLDLVRANSLRQQGWQDLGRAEPELVAALGHEERTIDASVAVSDDWVREVVLCAGRHKSGLIYVEAPGRGLAGGFPHGDVLEQLLQRTPCDVAVYRGMG